MMMMMMMMMRTMIMIVVNRFAIVLSRNNISIIIGLPVCHL